MNRAPSKTEFAAATPAIATDDRKPVATQLRAIDCNTPEQWAQWAAERREYEDPYGYQRARY